MSSGTQQKQGLFEQMWKSIIRPPRFHYQISDLGAEVWVLNKCVIRRYDFTTVNPRGLTLECSYFEPMRVLDKPHHCVIYLHGNSSSRLEALGILEFLIPYDIAVIAFDFSGCGLSQGQYISLGYFEKEDVQSIFDWLRQNKPMVDQIALWGRSMGSVTAILASKIIPDIKILVCDSPFVSLRLVCQNVAQASYRIPICLFSIAFCFIRRKIFKEARFDVEKLDIGREVLNLPKDKSILFLSAKGDTLINPRHPSELFRLFQGQKKIYQFEGNHNSRRPREIHMIITQFIRESTKINEYSKKEILIPSQTNYTKIPDRGKIQSHQIRPKSLTPTSEQEGDEQQAIINQQEQVIQSDKKIINQHTFVENINSSQKNLKF